MNLELKQILLDTGEFVDNEYLAAYVVLIEQNKFNKKELYRTQRHHIIPKCYYKNHNLPINNDASNLVNLLFKDHVLAHCYIVLASVESQFKYHNMVALYKLCNHRDFKGFDYKNLEEFQLAYECSRQIMHDNNPMFIEKYKLEHDELMRSPEMRAKLSAGMKKYRQEHGFSEEHRKHLSDAAKGNKRNLGKKRIYNSLGKMKYVYEEDLSEYLNNGWVLNKDKDIFNIPKTTHGYKMSKEELHVSLSNAHKGSRMMNNGIIQKQVVPSKISEFLEKGFVYGTLKKPK